jgi:hypothetical protein
MLGVHVSKISQKIMSFPLEINSTTADKTMRRYDTQHNDTQHNDIQDNETQHNI